MTFFAAFFCAYLFALGLGLSGMMNPENVIGFLDLFGDWKFALALVLGASVIVHSILYRFIVKRESPVFSMKFQLPSAKHIDKKLIFGSFIFGIGWGLSGYCPGPAVASLVTLNQSVIVFCAAMLAGMALYHYVFKSIFLKD